MSGRVRAGAEAATAAIGLGAVLTFGALAVSGAASLHLGPVLLTFAPERGGAVARRPSGLKLEVGHRKLGIGFDAGDEI